MAADVLPTVSARGRGRCRRLLLAAVAAAVVVVGYLVLSMLAPRTIPRLAVMPEPESRGVWWDDCEGRPLNRHEEEWLKGDVFWMRSEFQTLAGCPADFQ